MHEQLPTLAMTEPVYAEIREVIAETRGGMETGVTLFGARQAGCRVALFAVGPGPNTICTPVFHKPDADHLNREFERLKESYPALEWIGSLHVHPFGMPGLSGHDHRTVENLLALHPEPLHLPDFIAGIIQRRGAKFAIYPYFFEVGDTHPWLLPVQILPQEAELIRQATEAAGTHPDPVPQSRLTDPELPMTGKFSAWSLFHPCLRILRRIRSTRDRHAQDVRTENQAE